MSAKERYYDIDGNECTLSQLVRKEPEWAVSRIKLGEAAIEMLDTVHRMMTADGKQLNELKSVMRSIMRED